MLRNAARTAVSALGERMPLSHGANMTPSARRGDLLGHPVEVLVGDAPGSGRRPRRPPCRGATPSTPAVVVVDQHVLAGQRRWHRRHLASSATSSWTACGYDPRRGADRRVAVEVVDRSRERPRAGQANRSRPGCRRDAELVGHLPGRHRPPSGSAATAEAVDVGARVRQRRSSWRRCRGPGCRSEAGQHRRLESRRPSGEAQVEVVDRLHEGRSRRRRRAGGGGSTGAGPSGSLPSGLGRRR